MTNRPLTPEELDLAPEWATRCFITTNGDVIYQDGEFRQLLPQRKLEDKVLCKGFISDSVEIKSLNIGLKDWSDSDVKDVVFNGIELVTKFNSPVTLLLETKQDITNKAKALGITWEDLK